MSYVIRIATVCLLVGGGYLRLRDWRRREPGTSRGGVVLVGIALFAAYLLAGLAYDLAAG